MVDTCPLCGQSMEEVGYTVREVQYFHSSLGNPRAFTQKALLFGCTNPKCGIVARKFYDGDRWEK